VKLKDAHPIVADILLYRELQKLLSTYIDNLPQLVTEDGRLHTTLNQAGTTTGRIRSPGWLDLVLVKYANESNHLTALAVTKLDVLSGQKKIESRWYLSKHKPWNGVKEGETVYFKDSGGPVRIKAEVSRVMQFADLTPKRVKELLDEYGEEDGIEKSKTAEFFERFKNKKYCLLVSLKNPQEVEPFEIDKTGFGAMAAWITIDDISKIRK